VDDLFASMPVPPSTIGAPGNAASAPQVSRPRRSKKKNANTPTWVLALLAVSAVAAIGGLCVVMVIAIGNGSVGDSESGSGDGQLALAGPPQPWNPEPTRLASFTLRLSIAEYSMRGPAGLVDFTHLMPMPPMGAGVSGQIKIWAKSNSEKSVEYLIYATISDFSRPLGTITDDDRHALLRLAVDRQNGQGGWITTKRHPHEEGYIQGQRFLSARFEGTDDDPQGRVAGNAVALLNLEGQRAIILLGVCFGDSDAEAAKTMETILYSFQERAP
jgi:hypothetical protein